ncbi:MAG TPA: TauD/TfdA family dioxygenase [Burkholderiales bacterium]|jgi:taurine dioxygenase|nr:TauD/TfdA family dioxygenase [Burkholderiales bacterium]
MKISPLGDVMGAEVTGVDLSNLSAAEREALNQALLDHLVLCVRDQHFDDVGPFLDGARNFGVPKVQHLESYRSDKNPEAGVITSEDRDVKDGKRIIRGTMFHTDESFISEPPKATVVYAVTIPGKGGNTRFVNMRKAYETLDEATKKQIEALQAVHYYGKQRPGRKVPSLTDEQLKNTPPVTHPVVRTNQETGKKALYVHETMTDYVVDMEPAQSEALLRKLYDHSAQNPALQYSHAWRTGDFVIWDDRATLHAATADYAENEKRLLYRTMIKGGPTH